MWHLQENDVSTNIVYIALGTTEVYITNHAEFRIDLQSYDASAAAFVQCPSVVNVLHTGYNNNNNNNNGFV